MKKKNLFTIALLLTCYCSYAQTNTFPASGNVGIGTTTPQGKLHVYDATAGGVVIRAGSSSGTGFTLLGDGYSGIQTNLNLGLGYSNLKGVLSYGVNVSGTTSDTYLSSQDQFSTSRWAITMGGASSQNWNLLYAPVTKTTAGTAISMLTAMTVNTSGNVSIGTTNSQGYMLAVNGSAIATSMTVKLNANWPDYVFKKDYHLPSLTEVKAYIDQNQHLPDMPSAQEVEKDGQNLGEMNKLLTKKVEELTLYLIEQSKQINELKQQLSILTKALNTNHTN